MLKAFVKTLRFILILAGHKQIALENAALRQQLTILKRTQPRPKLRHHDRLFWIVLMKIWKQWRTALVIVQPTTVVSWQRRRFKQYWSRLSQKKKPGRPQVSTELRKLVRTMAAANVTWGAPRIHGELLKLG
jgi:putative transposase